MENLISISQQRTFTIEEARRLLPVIYRITEQYHTEVKMLANRLKGIREVKPDLAVQLEGEINSLVEKWNGKVARLGATPKGLWLADFDNGEGYYCWKFPENDILHRHAYHEGFSGRVSLTTM